MILLPTQFDAAATEAYLVGAARAGIFAELQFLLEVVG